MEESVDKIGNLSVGEREDILADVSKISESVPAKPRSKGKAVSKAMAIRRYADGRRGLFPRRQCDTLSCERVNGLNHGSIAWVTTTVVPYMLTTSVGAFGGGTGVGLGSAIGTVSQKAATAATTAAPRSPP